MPSIPSSVVLSYNIVVQPALVMAAILTIQWVKAYHDDSTASRLLSEVKHRRAQLVLRWGTTLESLGVVLFVKFWDTTVHYSVLLLLLLGGAVLQP